MLWFFSGYWVLRVQAKLWGASTASIAQLSKNIVKQKLPASPVLVGSDHVFGSVIWILKGPGPQVCANCPSVVHVSTDETLVDGCNGESIPFHVLLMSLLSWPPPVELLLSEVLLPPLALRSMCCFFGSVFPKSKGQDKNGMFKWKLCKFPTDVMWWLH